MKTLVLLIDDDKNYCEQIKKEAVKSLIDLTYVHNLEEAIELIDHNRRINAVILDGHCFLEAGQNGDPKSNFVYHALHSLDDQERDQSRIIPRCVNTELPADFRDELQGLIPVFSKNGDSNQMFRWVRQVISELPETRIREQHPDIFDDAAMIFTDIEEDELTDLILFSDQPDDSDIPAKLAVIRRLLEKITDICTIKLLKDRPESYASKMGVSVKPVFDALYARKLVPRPILRQVHSLYSFCSEFGTHIYRLNNPIYIPGIYAYRRNLNCLLEIISYCQGLISHAKKQ